MVAYLGFFWYNYPIETNKGLQTSWLNYTSVTQ
jgi:hypothetical protein